MLRKIAGVMHACGHDGHTAIGLTVAKMLNAHRDELSGTIKFCFQPSEEGTNGEETGGNELMMRDGVLDSPKVDMTLALHLWNEKPLGWIGITPGPTMAGGEIFNVRITGRGGHGAIPDMAVDPIIAAAQIVDALQSIVSRNVSPLDGAVVSVTSIHGGTAFNVIPQEVTLEGTIRSFDPGVRQKVMTRFVEIVRGVGEALGCQTEVEIKRITPALVNDAARGLQCGRDRPAAPAGSGSRFRLPNDDRRRYGLHAGKSSRLFFLHRLERQSAASGLRSSPSEV